MTKQTPELKREPLRYRIRAFLAKPANILLIVFLLALVILSLAPMVTMLSNMFTIHIGTEKNADPPSHRHLDAVAF